jgi:putative DNA primase/helicase
MSAAPELDDDISAAYDQAQKDNVEAEIERLTQLNDLDYVLARKPSAERLGLGVGDIDKLVRNAKRAKALEAAAAAFAAEVAARETAKAEAPKTTKAVETVDAVIRAGEDKAEIERLAALSDIDYERTRKEAAGKLGVERLSVLDAAVKAVRGGAEEASAFSEPHWVIEPWGEPVSLDELLDTVADVIARYMEMDIKAVHAISIYIVLSYVGDVFDVFPYLYIRSPVPGCGKSRLQTLIHFMGFKTLLELNPTPSTLFRTIEEVHPTLLLDEVDRFIKSSDTDMIGILNTGYKRGGRVPRVEEVGGERVVKRFATWCLKVFTGIGALPRTLAERSITTVLQKKRKGVKSVRLRERDTGEFSEIRSKALRWANDNRRRLDDIRDHDAVAFPDALGDRDGETWEPLLAVALLAGEVWQKRATQAAEGLTGAVSSDDDEYGLLLLAHTRAVFDANPDHVSLPSKFLFEGLTGNEEWPWRERGGGKDRQRPLTLAAMQAALRDFQVEVEPSPIHHKGAHGKKRGYLRASFEEAWQTYCPLQESHNLTSEDLSSLPSYPPISGCSRCSNAHSRKRF